MRPLDRGVSKSYYAKFEVENGLVSVSFVCFELILVGPYDQFFTVFRQYFLLLAAVGLKPIRIQVSGRSDMFGPSARDTVWRGQMGQTRY